MQWETYYDKIDEWAVSTAVSRMSGLCSFGPPDEVIYAISAIGYEDEKGATRLLKKAVDAGVKFSGDQLSELCLTCEEAVLNRAILASADCFTTEDLRALYGCCDEDILLDIAKKQRLRLPEELEDYAVCADVCQDEDTPDISELIGGCDFVLDCLHSAHTLLKRAYDLSLVDTNRKNRTATVLKYTHIADAQSYITQALDAWTELDIPEQDKQPLQGIWPNISNSVMWQNYLLEGLFTNMLVKREIRKVIRNIEAAHRMVSDLRDGL